MTHQEEIDKCFEGINHCQSCGCELPKEKRILSILGITCWNCFDQISSKFLKPSFVA